MKYFFTFLVLVSVTFAQQKEQRYQIFLMFVDGNKIEFQHTPVPTIGTPKQIPILLDTFTGRTWFLDPVLEQKNGKNIIRWKWVEIVSELPLLSQ